MLVGYLRPHTALYECPAEHFYSFPNDRCEHCHSHLPAACGAGQRMRGCAALERDLTCVNCTGKADLVEQGRARWLENEPGDVCRWTCTEEHWFNPMTETCVDCQAQGPPCDVGQRWQACTNTSDAQCVPCAPLRVEKGRYGDNEEYVLGNGTECQTACKENHYRDQNDRCRLCSTVGELLELALETQTADSFYRFTPCRDDSDAVAHKCIANTGTQIVDHASAFNVGCKHTCVAGYRPDSDTDSDTCVPCSAPLAHNSTLTLSTPLPHGAYAWDIDNDPHASSCNFTCVAPYVHTSTRPYAYTTSSCVQCHTECGTGTYLTGQDCDECRACEHTAAASAIMYKCNTTPAVDDHTCGVEFVTADKLDQEATCDEQCKQGFYAPWGRLAQGCVPHTQENCTAGHWLRAGGATYDAVCQRCESCEGRRETKACGANHSSECVSCGEIAFPDV